MYKSHIPGHKMPDFRKPRPIFIKLITYVKCFEVFGSKKKLTKSEITICKHLTSERMKALKSVIS